MNVYSAPEEIEIPTLDFRDIAGYQQATEDYLEAVQKWVRDNGERHALSGEVVKVPYADGHAVYVIGKFAGRVGLVHIDTWDGWRDPIFEETATVKQLTARVDVAKRREAFFAERAGV